MIFHSKKHLKTVCMNYFEHFCLSMYFSGQLFVGSIKSFFHALIPAWFTTSTSDLIFHLKTIINNVGCSKQ
jgi:hypothetical protein